MTTDYQIFINKSYFSSGFFMLAIFNKYLKISYENIESFQVYSLFLLFAKSSRQYIS